MAPHVLAGALPIPGAYPPAGIVVPGPSPHPGPLPIERTVPVLPELAGLFPGAGLPKGGTVLMGPATAPGLTSLLLLLLAGASSQGHWCAVAGLPELGPVAAAELGADLSHLVLVPNPGPEGRWQNVVATLLETVDLVCFAPSVPVRPGDARRLSARARERCSVLVVFDTETASSRVARGFLPGGASRPGRAVPCWPGPSDLRCAIRSSEWSGLERGHGRLGLRHLEAEVGGRGSACRPRRDLLRLPA